jgi:hypothetical protein
MTESAGHEKTDTTTPHPWKPLGKAAIGKWIDVSEDTIQRVVNAILDDEPMPNVKNPDLVIPVAELFAKEGRGGKIMPGHVYELFGVDPYRIAGSPPAITFPASDKKVRQRADIPDPDTLAKMSDEEIRGELHGIVGRVRTKGGHVPREKAAVLVGELHRRDQRFHVMVGGINWDNLAAFITFDSFGVFMAKAGPNDLWPFVIPQGDGRPVDLLFSSEDEIRWGSPVLMTLQQWLEAMARALAAEEAAKAMAQEALWLGRGVELASGRKASNEDAPADGKDAAQGSL